MTTPIFNFKKIKNNIRFVSLFILLISIVGCISPKQAIEERKDVIHITQVETDSLFKSNQQINLLEISKKSFEKYTIDIGYNNFDLINTSQIAKSNNAIAAINGGFYDMDKGGSVTYFEKNDSVITRTMYPEFNKWAKVDSLINGAIILTKNNTLEIRSVNTDQFYEKSKKETFVLINGPMLLRNSTPQKLPNLDFTNDRHPRTCLCTTKESVFFIVIDGRMAKADGMTLHEAQKYLLDIGCIDAINLDGGGSSTMWAKDKGIINNPSDKKGERPVANALLILKKQ